MQGVRTQDTATTSDRPAGGYGPPLGGQHPTAGEAAVQCFRDFSREKPEVVAMWAFGLGFILGWKLRIW